MRLLILAVISFSLLTNTYAHNPHQQTAEDCALEETLDYCARAYPSRNNYYTCQNGATTTYEHVLSEEVTDFNTICHPYYLNACDSGRKIFLAKLKLHKK
jgi:hypothetical protein